MRSLSLLALAVALPCAAQPVLIADVNPGPGNGFVIELEALGDDVYFSGKGAGGTELWRYVTATGTAERVTNLPAQSLKPDNLVDADGVLYFTGTDDAHGRELWRYDPVTDVAEIVADLIPGPDPSTPDFTAAFDGDVYFRAYTLGSGKELWRYDPDTGTAVQTPEIRAVGSASPVELTPYDGDLYFRAFDDPVGDELWRHDPATNTNILVADLVAGAQNGDPKFLTVHDGVLYFFVRSPGDGPLEELWSYDAAADTAAKLADIPPGAGADWNPGGLTEADGALYFFAGSLDGADDLWRYDLTTTIASLVTDLPPGSDAQTPEVLGVIAGVIYFAASADADGRELWQHDTASGITSRVADIAPGAASGYPVFAIVHQGALYFSADDGVNGRELWRYQPSAAGEPYLLTGDEGYRTLALPKAGLPLGGRGPGYLTNLWTAGYKGADRDQRNRRGLATVFLYDEATGAFTPPEHETSVAPGQGMWVFVTEDDEPYTPGLQGGFPKHLDPSGGTPVTGSVSFPLTYTPATSPSPGFNLVGNPYDEAIDWDDPSWTKTDVSTTVYVYDPAYNGGDYRTWDGTTGDLEGGVIPAGQAFTAVAFSSSAVLTVTEAAKTDSPGVIYGKAAPLGVSFRLGGTVGGAPRETAAFVTLRESAALGLDPQDGRRLAGAPGASALRLYSVADDAALSLAALPLDLAGETEIPLHAEALGADARATLVWDAAHLPAGWTATLRDHHSGATHDLSAPGEIALTLDAQEATRTDGPPVARAIRVSQAQSARFSLVLTPPGRTTAKTDGPALVLGEIGPNPARGSARLALTLAEAGEVVVRVFDALGREVVVSRATLGAGAHQVAVPVRDLAPGAYVVRAEAGGGTEVRRLTVVR